MSAARQRRILWTAATDSTFEPALLDGRRVLVGKCIHCNTKLVVDLEGRRAAVTLEHIVPRHHGGDDRPENLALSCTRCNNAKGIHHDAKSIDDPGLRRVIEILETRRRRRMRPPIAVAGIALPTDDDPAVDSD